MNGASIRASASAKSTIKSIVKHAGSGDVEDISKDKKAPKDAPKAKKAKKKKSKKSKK